MSLIKLLQIEFGTIIDLTANNNWSLTVMIIIIIIFGNTYDNDDN